MLMHPKGKIVTVVGAAVAFTVQLGAANLDDQRPAVGGAKGAVEVTQVTRPSAGWQPKVRGLSLPWV